MLPAKFGFACPLRETLREFGHNKHVLWFLGAGSTIGAIYLINKYMQGKKFTKPISAEGKVIIVTGCNTGIGKETVRELARRGGTVYMACRDMQKCEEARDEIVQETFNSKVYCLQLDLASLDSIRQFVEQFKQKETKLDILVNNAGVGMTPYTKTKDGFEMQIGVNHLGHFLLTELLLDLLKQSAPSRIVVVASNAHRAGKIKKDDLNSEKSYRRGAAYCQSKLANILFAHELAKKLQGTGVTVNSLHPGAILTSIGRHLPFANTFVSKGAEWLLTPFTKSVSNGAQTILYAALDSELNEVSGKYLNDCAIEEPSKHAQDDEMASWLWSASEEMIRNASS